MEMLRYLQRQHPGPDCQSFQDRTLGKISDPNMGPLSITSYNCCVFNYMKIQSLMKTKGRGRSGERKEGRGEKRKREAERSQGALGPGTCFWAAPSSGLTMISPSEFSRPASSEVTRTQAKEQFTHPQAILVTLGYSEPTLTQQDV